MADEEASKLDVYLLLILTPLFAFLCLFGIFYSYWTSEDFPEVCLQQYSACYMGLIIPITIPVFVVFMYFNWMGLKFFVHN